MVAPHWYMLEGDCLTRSNNGRLYKQGEEKGEKRRVEDSPTKLYIIQSNRRENKGKFDVLFEINEKRKGARRVPSRLIPFYIGHPRLVSFHLATMKPNVYQVESCDLLSKNLSFTSSIINQSHDFFDWKCLQFHLPDQFTSSGI